MRNNTKLLMIAGLIVTIGLAVLLSPYASSKPDGLDRVAADNGFLESATDHSLSDSPVADYSVRGVDDARLSTGLAGLVGVLITLGIGLALFACLRILRPKE
jgi:hypothetical protein